MNKKSNNQKILIVTGFPPVNISVLNQLGINSDALPTLMTLFDKGILRFTIPPLGPVSIASYIKQNRPDIEIKVEDYYFDGIHCSGFDIIGLSSTFMQIEDIKHVITDIKQQNPTATIVMGGPHDWAKTSNDVFNLIPGIDYVVQQEGEETFIKLIDCISGNKDPKSVKGIIFKDKKNNIVETPLRPPVVMEKLPLPAWELMGLPSAKRLPVLPIETSRGCPYHCVYCSDVTFWGKPARYHSIERVINEIIQDAAKYKTVTFRFADSCFSAPPERCAALCDAIYENCIKIGIPVKWSSYARIENLSPSLLEKMKRSGCVALDVGLESASRELLKKMGKKYDPEMAVNIAKTAKELNILINYNILIGFPGETQDTLKATTDLIQRSAPNTYACCPFSLLPNSTISDQREKYGITGNLLSWQHATMTSEEANEAQFKIAREINNSTCFLGGEHFACYLSSVGFSTQDIAGLFRAIGIIAMNPSDENTLTFLKQAAMKMASFF